MSVPNWGNTDWGALGGQTTTPTTAYNPATFGNDDWVNQAGDRYYGDSTQGAGGARAGTKLAGGAISTWVNYDGSKDTFANAYQGGAGQPGGSNETNWRRVNRWTQHYVSQEGMKPQEAHNKALMRLKRDLTGPGRDWRQSGYDLSNVPTLSADGKTSTPPVQTAAPGQPTAPQPTAPQTTAPQATTGGGGNVGYPNDGGGQTGPTGPTGPTGQTGAGQYNAYLLKDKAARMSALLGRLGLGDPMRQRSVFGSAVGGQLGKLLDPWMQTQGMAGGNVADNQSSLIDQFVNKFNTGGGGMGSVAADASNAARIASSDPKYASLEDPELIAMLQGFSQLANLPQNPWMQRAYGNIQDDSVANFYGKVDQAAKGGGDPASVRYLNTIKSNPIFSFLTGQGR